ncbi:SOSS complex subunit B-like [Vitis vinifera]|uniref:SOSS complex subunit B-like n=1 Tax=Vitis vinifera TaxID=29760 RepID=A0A438CDE6_VITVI|nr:SOSS complex subunit B-like [Vitis vinifera]
MLSLKDMVPAAQNNINTQFIILDKGKTTLEGKYKTCLTLVADETAAVHFQMWGDECDAFEGGDIIRLVDGIFSYNRNNLVLRAGKKGKAEKVGEFCMAFVETPNMSEIRWIPDPSNPKNCALVIGLMFPGREVTKSSRCSILRLAADFMIDLELDKDQACEETGDSHVETL